MLMSGSHAHTSSSWFIVCIRWSQKLSRRKPVVKISLNSGSIRDEDNKAVHSVSHKWHSESLWNAKVLIKYYQLNLHLSIQLLIKQQVTRDLQQATECCIDSLSNKKVAAMLQCHRVVDFVKWISKRSHFSRKINFWTCVQQKKKKKAPKPFLIISAAQDRAAESLCNNGDYRI